MKKDQYAKTRFEELMRSMAKKCRITYDQFLSEAIDVSGYMKCEYFRDFSRLENEPIRVENMLLEVEGISLTDDAVDPNSTNRVYKVSKPMNVVDAAQAMSDVLANYGYEVEVVGDSI